jgi:predicted Zn-dependent protease
MKAETREERALRALSFSDADQTEVLVSSSDFALTRFTHESIHQNVATGDASISVRAIVGGRTGVARTNTLTDDGLRDVVQRARAMATLAPVDPDQPQLPAGAPVTPPDGAFDLVTSGLPEDARARMAGTAFTVAEGNDCWCAGYTSTDLQGVTVVNSNGARASFDETEAAMNVKMIASDSSGFAEGRATALADVDAMAIASRAARKATQTAKPRGVDPGAWTVILEPPAFGELLSYAIGHFSAESYHEGTSYFSGALGKAFFPDNVTIRDDYAHPLAPGMPFDFEGQPTMRLPLVERGVVRNVVTDSYWAKKLDRANTGHALPAPNNYGPSPRAVVVDPGVASTEELIADTKRGLLVSRFWYIRTVDQKHAVVTGMTRDGTYLIEDGKLVGGVRNLRFNQSIIDALKNVTFSNEQHRTAGDVGTLVTPAAKIEHFNFTSTTEF